MLSRMIKQRYFANRIHARIASSVFLVMGLLTLSQVDLPATERIVTLSAGSADGDSIQSALNGLPRGGEVFLGPGTYVVRRPIVLQRDFLTLRGSGPETILYL